MGKLEGKSVLITGASRGIGKLQRNYSLLKAQKSSSQHVR